MDFYLCTASCLENVAGDICGVRKIKTKVLTRGRCAFVPGYLVTLMSLFSGRVFFAAVAPAVSSRFYCPERVFGTIKPSFMQQGINVVLLKVITLYRPNTRCVSAV